MSVRALIIEQITQVGQQQDKRLAPLNDALPLMESGLDSLCIAIIVARLDDALDVDPFSASTDVLFPVTLGDFIRLYEHVAV